MEKYIDFNSSLVITEVALLLIIIGIQIYSSIKTYWKIKRFGNSFPEKISFIENLAESDDTETEIDNEIIKTINVDQYANKDYNEMVGYINTYLHNSTNNAPEYSVIEEITEKISESADENVNVTLFSPLYLGLMGTILGIIFGVLGFVLQNSGSSDDILTEIRWLLIGVGVAMSASFIGLLLSLLNSNIHYRRARTKHNKNKLNFLNKVRVELLPSYQFKDTSTIPSLHRAIDKFNRNLSKNIKKLGEYNEKNVNSVETQRLIIDKLDQLNLDSIINNNIKLLSSFSENIKHLDKLNTSLNNVNQFVSESSSLSAEANRLFSRFKHFESNSQKIFDEMGHRLKVSEDLLLFLDSHFKELNSRGVLIRDAIGNVDDAITSSINELIEKNRANLSNYTENVGEIDSTLESSVKDIKHHLERQLQMLVAQTEQQAEFIGKGHEVALRKYDDALNNLTRDISDKVSNVAALTENETVKFEKAVEENKESLSKLHKLEEIKSLLDEFKTNQHEIFNKLVDFEIQLTRLNGRKSSSGSNKTKKKEPEIPGKEEKPNGFFSRIRKLFRSNN